MQVRAAGFALTKSGLLLGIASALVFTLFCGAACAIEPARKPFPLPPADSSATTFEVQSLNTGDVYRRLEAAEARLRALEQERSALVKESASNSALGKSPVDDGIALLKAEEPKDDLAAALRELEDKHVSLEKEYEKLSDKLAKGLVIPGTSNATVRLFGRIHADYWAFPNDDAAIQEFEGMNPQDRFGFRRVRIGVDGKIRDNMLYKIEMEFAGGNEPVYKDVYFGFTDLPFLQTALIGNQKRPYGLDHLNSSRYNIFMERPFIIEAFNQDSRRLGIVSYGVSEDEVLNWRYGVYNLEDSQTDPGYFSDHYQLEVAGRLANTYWYDKASDGRNYGHCAISFNFAAPDDNGGPLSSNEARFRTRPEARTEDRWLNTGRIANARHYQLLGLEKVVNVGPMQFAAEYQNTWLQRNGPGEMLHFWGGYAYLAYMLTGEHVPWERDSGTLGRVKPFENFFLVEQGKSPQCGGWGAWQVAVRYSHADLSSDDILGGVGDSVTFGLNWYWNPNARVQFNYLHGWINDHEPVNGQTEGEYDIVGVRGMVDF